MNVKENILHKCSIVLKTIRKKKKSEMVYMLTPLCLFVLHATK